MFVDFHRFQQSRKYVNDVFSIILHGLSKDYLRNQAVNRMPLSVIIGHLIFYAAITETVQLPFLSNVTLVPKYNSTSVTLTDRSCDQCLCESDSYSILNCFPNATCQLFVDAPVTYTLKPTPNALLYFPRQILPNASQCCMPNTTDLLNRLSNAMPTYAPVNGPRCLIIDNHGYLVTVSYFSRTIVRFDPNNLTEIDQSPSPISSDQPLTLAYYNGAYYVGFGCYILVVDSDTMILLHNISSWALQGARDMIFLNDGQQMIVTAFSSSRLLFFNRSSLTSHDYDFIGYQNVSCQGPHGLFYTNDALFYLTSFINNTVYKYSKSENATAWIETLVLDASLVAPSSDGNHVLVDGCDRYWLSLGYYGIRLFDRQGSPRGSLHASGSGIFDTLMLDNYVMYLSEYLSNRITRIDPTIHC